MNDTPTRLPLLSAAEMAEGFARGRFTPLEVAEAVLAQAARLEPTLHALWALEPEAVLEAARASTERHRRGAALSALDGVPVTIKENIATRGCPVPLGTAAVELVPAPADAPPAARLREAGCVLLAKTTMPDLGMLTSGLSSFHALSRNPWNPACNPGGSSAGAAAACAGGYGPLHLGTDIGGSIRLPAGWCGVYGFKPSGGRVPIQPPYIGRVAGPLGRSVRDIALAMQALALPDRRDTTSLPAQALPWDAIEGLEPRGLRIGLWLEPGWGLPVAPAVAAAVQAVARRLEAAGAVVEPMPPVAPREVAAGIDRFWRLRAWCDLRAMPEARRSKVLPYILQWAEGAAGISAEEAFHAFSQMGAMRERAVAATGGFDFVLAPVCPVGPMPAEWASPTNDPVRALEHIAFTLPFNMSEQPALSAPAGLDEQGLPVGVQLIGARHDDLGVLRLARLWEQMNGPLVLPPLALAAD